MLSLGHTTPSVMQLRDPQERSGVSSPLLPAQGPTIPVLSSQDHLVSACHYSGTNMSFGVVSSPTASCLPQLRDPQNLCCLLETHCPLQAAQALKEPVLSSWDSLGPCAACRGQ